MKTVYINPKTQSFSVQSQSFLMQSPYADPTNSDQAPKMDKLA